MDDVSARRSDWPLKRKDVVRWKKVETPASEPSVKFFVASLLLLFSSFISRRSFHSASINPLPLSCRSLKDNQKRITSTDKENLPSSSLDQSKSLGGRRNQRESIFQAVFRTSCKNSLSTAKEQPEPALMRGMGAKETLSNR